MFDISVFVQATGHPAIFYDSLKKILGNFPKLENQDGSSRQPRALPLSTMAARYPILLQQLCATAKIALSPPAAAAFETHSTINPFNQSTNTRYFTKVRSGNKQQLALQDSAAKPPHLILSFFLSVRVVERKKTKMQYIVKKKCEARANTRTVKTTKQHLFKRHQHHKKQRKEKNKEEAAGKQESKNENNGRKNLARA